ncbi:hypothetical protein IAQ61_010395 [Plenodomus lingam]|uniref:uncharacterized protein n=1 Tax=Leptosphaeria maculans TaxID=5022 RepID=UPI00331D235F|nr:hypothetical protein IAQ61_010395 [Plenodomus lingam]
MSLADPGGHNDIHVQKHADKASCVPREQEQPSNHSPTTKPSRSWPGLPCAMDVPVPVVAKLASRFLIFLINMAGEDLQQSSTKPCPDGPINLPKDDS